ncbi:MAG TPA: Ig domain-containing protein [Gaiellaceae bacterium]|nr:Ig domain-containing protein [Gaiellaceae bacterium]
MLVAVAAGVGATADAAVTVSRAELDGTRLRIEGQALANRAITVDGVTMGTSDGSGKFRIERDPFTPPADCTVDVDDGSGSPAVATLAGCTVPSPPPPPPPPPPAPQPPPPPPAPPAGITITTQSPLLNGNVGTDYTGFIEACCFQGGPVRWSLVAGRVPDGMQFAGDSLRLTQTTAVLGRPRTVQTTSFTVEARDQAGNTTRKGFSLTIDPPRPLVITNGTDTLTPGRVGESYAIGLFADGGIPPYRWSLVTGQLPPGLSLQVSPGRISGTPTTAGTFVFTVRVTDEGGQQATQQFSITISP